MVICVWVSRLCVRVSEVCEVFGCVFEFVLSLASPRLHLNVMIRGNILHTQCIFVRVLYSIYLECRNEFNGRINCKLVLKPVMWKLYSNVRDFKKVLKWLQTGLQTCLEYVRQLLSIRFWNYLFATVMRLARARLLWTLSESSREIHFHAPTPRTRNIRQTRWRSCLARAKLARENGARGSTLTKSREEIGRASCRERV